MAKLSFTELENVYMRRCGLDTYTELSKGRFQGQQPTHCSPKSISSEQLSLESGVSRSEKTKEEKKRETELNN